MVKVLLVWLCCMLGFAGCSSSKKAEPSSASNIEGNGSLSKIQNKAVVHAAATYFFDGTIQVRLLKVEQDSRCPKTAQCKWAGNAEVHFDLVFADNKKYMIQLNTNKRFDRVKNIKGYQVRLSSLYPAKEISSTIQLEAYIAQIEISTSTYQE